MPLFWLSLVFLCGIWLASASSIPMVAWAVVAGLAGVFAILPVFRHFTRHRLAGKLLEKLRIPSLALFPLMIVLMCGGAIRYQASLPRIDPAFIAYYNDTQSPVTIQGVISEPVDARDTYSNLHVDVILLTQADGSQSIPVGGTLLARLPSNVSFSYGDEIRLQGKLETPPENEDFSYRDYLAHQGIYSYLPYPIVSLVKSGQGSPLLSILYSFRQKAVDMAHRLFPDPEASLVAGIVLGEQSGISRQLQEAFQLTGTSHILVISGFNITLVAGIFTFVFRRVFGRYRGALVALLGIVVYTLLVGANAAVVRAAILGVFTLIGHLIGRRQSGVNSLAIVAAIMAGVEPGVLWDVSFQLSFAATMGIMLYAEPMTGWFIHLAARVIPQDKAEKLAGPVGEYFLLTLAAQLTTLPLMIYYFKRLSLTSLIANPLILPAQPALMVLGGLAVLTGLLVRPLGQLVAWAAWPFAAYTARMVEWLALIPHGSIALGQVALLTIPIFYTALLIFTLARSRVGAIAARLIPAVPLVGLVMLVALTWKAAFSAPDGRLHVTVLDVGTGEGVLIQTAAGQSVLINGGASTNKLSDMLGRRLPFFNRSVDWLVVADIDDEDLAGINGNLARFPPMQVLWGGSTYSTRTVRDLWTELTSTYIPITRMEAGQELDLGDGARLVVVSVSSKGAVLMMKWENFRMLLPMGVDFGVLESLENDSAMRNVSALLLAESGYAPANPANLIKQLNPQMAVLSVALADRTGLPSPETIEALQGYNLVRTDQNGWIEITTDGRKMWVEVERK